MCIYRYIYIYIYICIGKKGLHRESVRPYKECRALGFGDFRVPGFMVVGC